MLAAGLDDRSPLLEACAAGVLVARVDPRGWFEAFEGRRLHTGPGDPWLLWRCDWCPPIPRDRPRRCEDPAA